MANPHPPLAFDGEQSATAEDGKIFVSLTYDALDVAAATARVKSPSAGAVVLFLGTTRDTFASRAVTHLHYSAYAPLALRTLLSIARETFQRHGLEAVSITHRLGRVEVGEESVVVAVSAAHRGAAWRAGEACLEGVKERVEVWKEEWFGDGGVWRCNRD
ncbi:Molybdopterin biosynthesis MoaE, partial [Teratosphaeria nubilosa]